MAFYRRFGFSQELVASGALRPSDPDYEFGYGRSELDFLRWEIGRGVLNPLDGSRGPAGSRWWREVNLSFLYDGELAALGHQAGLDPPAAEPPVGFWMAYIQSPGERTWYRAHNTSIVAGYQRHLTSAGSEPRSEQIFINVVLYRLLFAQAMAEGAEFGGLGRFLCNPRLPSVDALVHLPDFYPGKYPLTRHEIRDVMHRGHSLEEAATICLDEILIHPQLARLYREASRWNAASFLERWVLRGEPVYPTLTSARPLLRRLLQWSRRLRRRR
jgi:hypothetical protein